MTALRSGAATDVGRVRSNNQDRLLVAEPLFAVADGMGGHAGGEVASLTAVEALMAGFEEDSTAEGLAEAVRQANRAVWQRAHERRELRGMGTTLTAVALVQDGDDDTIAVVNVGDSRAYLLRDGQLDQLTDDHSVPKELERAGRLSPEEAAVHPQHNVLTRALGIDEDVQVDTFDVTPYRGDRLLLASDGLFNEVSDRDIASVLRRLDDPDEAAHELVRIAKDHGGNDNITVIVVDVVDDDDRSARASASLATTRMQAVGSETTPRRQVGRPIDDADEDRARPGPTTPTTGESRPLPGPTGAPVSTARPPTPLPPESASRRLTLRVVVFVVLLLAVLGGAAAAVGFYARASYYVGLDGDQVVIFKGRPGGLLWFDPTVEERTRLTLDDVSPSRADDLLSGKTEPSLADAHRYVRNIEREAAPPPPTTTLPPPPPPAGPVPPP